MKRYLALFGIQLLVTSFFAADRPSGKLFATRSEVIAARGMVSTCHPLATQVGLDTLKQGGSAVDAAIAANAAMGLMAPVVSGIGGDLLAIVWDPETKRLYGLNASGRSPMGLTRAMLEAEGHSESVPRLGPLSISVPGCVDGWFELHDRFGRLSMREILKPTIEYAETGVPIPEMIALYWDLNVGWRTDRPDQFGFFETFSIGGRAPVKGEIWRNPALGKTLEMLAEGGRDVFYRGPVAKRIDAYMRSVGGYLRYEDLDAHRSDWVEPVSTNYRGWDVWELPPNGQGIAALQILNVLEGYDLASAGFGSIEHLHTLVEAKKLAFEDRAKFYADPSFSEAPVEWLISKEYAAQRRALIDPNRASTVYAPGVAESGDTIYLCAADETGMMVSLIQSNASGFGSGVCMPSLGFGFQNRGSMFTFEDGHANEYKPGKRPFHTIIPAFVTENGEPLLAFGLMGGSMQPQGHAQIVVNMKDFGMNVQEAGDAPRINHAGSVQPHSPSERQGDGGTILYENGFDPETLRELMLMGHHLQPNPGWSFGGYQAIYRDPASGVYFGAAESRQDGAAAGY